MTSIPLAAVEELTHIVGADAMSSLPEQYDSLSRTTLPEGTRPGGVVRPANREQVQTILRCAARHGFLVYPISRGKNWGYGDACAPRDGMLILDLSRMNRIVEVNTELAYAVIEPGVTQGELADYLRERNIPLMLDGNGAGPDASFVGNVLDRGFGHSAYGDRFSHSCNFEAVLADGTIMNRLRWLFLSGTLRTTVHCFNERRLLASEVLFPWSLSDGKQALEVSHPEWLRDLYRKMKAWAASGSPAEVAA